MAPLTTLSLSVSVGNSDKILSLDSTWCSVTECGRVECYQHHIIIQYVQLGHKSRMAFSWRSVEFLCGNIASFLVQRRQILCEIVFMLIVIC